MLPEAFNWLDIVITVILLLSILQGIRSGLIKSVFSIAGITAGLICAIVFYSIGSDFLSGLINIPRFIADALSFITIFSLSAAFVHLVGSFLSAITRLSLIKLADKAGGSAAGLVIGLALIGVILILLTAFPLYGGFEDHVEQSYLAPQIIETTVFVYEEISNLLSLELPRLSAHPEQVERYFSATSSVSEHYGVDFKGLAGAGCFVCGGNVEFLGYFDNNRGSTSPKFICTDCGRTSDGCQTYEGYHQMYHQCPVELGNQGYRLDCGIWTNHSYHRPVGPCPVCGTE